MSDGDKEMISSSMKSCPNCNYCIADLRCEIERLRAELAQERDNNNELLLIAYMNGLADAKEKARGQIKLLDEFIDAVCSELGMKPPYDNEVAVCRVHDMLEALRFYADPESYYRSVSPGRCGPSKVVADGGERAAKALGGHHA